jgi:drug/metabolite transporter (DMT)-like permease
VGRVLSHRGASTRSRAVGEPETGVVAEDPPLDGDETQGDEGTSLAAARGLLLAVPVLWATYNPALRFIYDSPTSPTPAELTSVRMLAAMVPFTAVFLSIARDAASTFGEDGVVDLSDERKDSDKVRDVRLLLRAGAELGLLNFLGTACQAWGLEQTTATRAGFLLSTINVGVPLFAAAGLGGVNAPAVTGPAWAACALALLGVLITDYSPDLAGVQPGDGFNAGDLGVLAAAVCYAAFTVRLGKWAREYDGPEDLAAVKLAVMFLCCGAWVLVDQVSYGAGVGGDWPNGGPWGSVLWAGGFSAGVWAAVVYSAVGPGALANLLQMKGQRTVPAAEAQVIFATTPVFNAVISVGFLGEAAGGQTLLGGAVIVAASVLPLVAEKFEDKKS